MTAPYLQGTGSVPEATALNLRGLQTDAYGEVMGGDRALFDFGLPSTPTSFAAGGVLPNLIVGKDAGSITFSVSDVDTYKGIRQAATSGDYRAYVSDAFNPAEMGSSPSFFVSAWITAIALSDYAGVACCADDNTLAGRSWRWLGMANGSIITNFTGNGGATDYPVTIAGALEVGVPHLITMVCTKTTATTFALSYYVDATLKGAISGIYGFVNPTRVPNFCYSPGQGSAQRMILHRARARKFDPAYFDVNAWLAAEIAANGSRW